MEHPRLFLLDPEPSEQAATAPLEALRTHTLTRLAEASLLGFVAEGPDPLGALADEVVARAVEVWPAESRDARLAAMALVRWLELLSSDHSIARLADVFRRDLFDVVDGRLRKEPANAKNHRAKWRALLDHAEGVQPKRFSAVAAPKPVRSVDDVFALASVAAGDRTGRQQRALVDVLDGCSSTSETWPPKRELESLGTASLADRVRADLEEQSVVAGTSGKRPASAFAALQSAARRDLGWSVSARELRELAHLDLMRRPQSVPVAVAEGAAALATINRLLGALPAPVSISSVLRGSASTAVPPLSLVDRKVASGAGRSSASLETREDSDVTKTMTRAEKERLRTRLIAEKNGRAARSPTAEVAALITNFSPTDPLAAACWDDIQSLFVEMAERSDNTGVDATRKLLTALSKFLAWANEAGHPLDAERLMRASVIDDFQKTGMRPMGAPGERPVSDKTRADYASRLRGLARNFEGSGLRQPLGSRRDSKITVPYSDAELQVLFDNLRFQKVGPSSVRLRLVVLLAVGVGARASDLRRLRVDDIDDRGDAGVWIRLSDGSTERVVPMLERFEAAFRAELDRYTPNSDLLVQSPGDSQNASGRLIDNANFRDADPPDMGRLRATWLAMQVIRPIPFVDLAAAAGVRSGGALFDLIDLIDISSVSPSSLRKVQ